ncbi:MAG TPA: HdeD family acid-resistance protein [Mycobacterium sp.]|nr:HdeD family acid-resistance protein [Mycobacterium sp.]HTX95728.1 HdeD family acid-resistance protein [Mycobacterium sp.]
MAMRSAREKHDLWKVVFAWGATTFILGILILARPGTSILVTAALLATYLVLSGIAELVMGAVLDVSASGRVPLFVAGGLSLALGVLTFRHFGYSNAVLLLAIAIGVGFFFRGASEIWLALEHPSLPDRWWYLLLGAVGVVAGIVMLAWPFKSLTAAMVAAGVCLVILGGGDMLWALRARRVTGNVHRTAQQLTTTGSADQRNSARDMTTR